MFLIGALCGLRIGEVTALKVASVDFKRKQIHILAALDYKTRRQTTPKSENSAAPVCMPELLAKHLREWLDKHHTPNAEGYLFVNSKSQPYFSENVIRSGVHRAMAKLGIVTPKGSTSEFILSGMASLQNCSSWHANPCCHADDAPWRLQGYLGALRARRRRCRACCFRAPIPQNRGSIGVRARNGVSLD